MTDLSLPDDNNCYGQLVARDLKGLAKMLAGRGWSAQVYRPDDFDTRERIRVRLPGLEFESEPLGKGEHLLNGAVSPEIAKTLLGKLSHDLADAGINHRLEYSSDGQEFRFQHRREQ